MKVKTLIEITLYLLILYVVNNGYSQAAFAQNKIPKPRWSLENEDTYITIAIINNRPAICELKNTKNGWNWIKEFSEMPLPEIVLSGDKSYQPDWKYKEAIMEKGNGTKLTLRFFSTIPNLELESVWEAKPGVGPVENMVSVKNISGGCIIFKNASVISSNITITADSAISLWRFNKARYLGLKYKTDYPLVNKQKIGINDSIFYFLSNDAMDYTVKGVNGHLPFQVFDVNSRHGLYIGYEWSFGIFKNRTGSDPLTVNYNAYLWDSSSVTKENGQIFNVPAMFYGTYTGDLDDGCNKMKRWFWNYKITPTLKNNPNEPLIEYCLPGDEAELIEFYKKYHVAEWGAELGKIDIEWLDGAGNDWKKGDFKKYANWVPDPAKWPHGMTAGDIVHSNNQKLSLYMNFIFEYNDIGTPEGRKKEIDALITRYDKWHYDYWRSDMTLEAPYSYLSHEGLLEILDYMISNRPDFRYEHCAGAGLLKDFTTLQRINVLTNEDSGGSDFHRESFYSSSYMINPVQIKADIAITLGPYGEAPDSSHNANTSPGWVNYVLRSGFLGANMSACVFDPDQIEEVKTHWQLYKTHQRPILRGSKVGDMPADVYHILPAPDGINWDGIEFFNTSLNKGSVILFKPLETAADSMAIIFKGLNRKEIYSIFFQDRKEQNTRMTGAELMEQGILVKGMIGKYASEIIWIN
jgi:hypothetical protein